MVAALPPPPPPSQPHPRSSSPDSSQLARRHASSSDRSSPAPRRPRNREITSRYKSPSSSSTSPSPSLSRRCTTTSSVDCPTPKRAQSAERRRPSPTRSPDAKLPNGSAEVVPSLPRRIAGSSELLWPSTRNVSLTMQAEPYSPTFGVLAKNQIDGRGKFGGYTPDHALKPSANVVQRSVDQRKRTPERKRTPMRCRSMDQAENARPLENVHSKPNQHHWPGTSNGKASGAAMSRSMDLNVDRDRPLSKAATLLVQGKSALNSSRLPRPVSSSRPLSQSINKGPAFCNDTRRAQAESRGRSRQSPVTARRGSSRDTMQSIGSPQLLCVGTGQETHRIRQLAQEAELASSDINASTENASDTDSVSSVGTVVAALASRGSSGSGTGARAARGTPVPARFLQDAVSRSRRLSEINNRLRASMPEPELSTAAAAAAGKQSSWQKIDSATPQGSVSSSPWSLSPNCSASVFVSPQQPLSPVKTVLTSPSRSLPSPTRSRGQTLPSPAGSFQSNRSGTGQPLPSPASSFQNSRSSSAATMLNFGVDTWKGKKSLTQLEEAHLHRVLHNRLLQWRFVNARAEAAMNTQNFTAEKLLFSVWAKTSELRASVSLKRIKLHQGRQKHKLNSIIFAQAAKLDDWSTLQQEHSTALLGAVGALEAAILRVPVTSGVRADTQAVREAMGSAVDVMNAVEFSINSLLPKVEKTNCLVSELAQVASQERALLEECGDLLATTSAFEVEEQSLRTHLVQLEQEKAHVLGPLLVNIAAGADPVSLSSS